MGWPVQRRSHRPQWSTNRVTSPEALICARAQDGRQGRPREGEAGWSAALGPVVGKLRSAESGCRRLNLRPGNTWLHSRPFSQDGFSFQREEPKQNSSCLFPWVYQEPSNTLEATLWGKGHGRNLIIWNLFSVEPLTTTSVLRRAVHAFP